MVESYFRPSPRRLKKQDYHPDAQKVTGIESTKAMQEWHCPKCPLVIRVPHPSTLAIDKALHLKKHEIDGY